LKVAKTKGHTCTLVLSANHSRLNGGRHASFDLASRFDVELTDIGDQEDLYLEYCHAVAKAASWASKEGQDIAPSTRQEVGAGDVLLLDPTFWSEGLTVTPN
jgi:hypothetical protein